MKKSKAVRYTLTLTEEQAKTLEHACEVYVRLSLAQIDTAVHLTLKIPDDAYKLVKDFCDGLKFLITKHPPNASYGIGSKELPKTVHTVHAIEQTIRHRLAWDRNPLGGHTVDFGTPLLFNGATAPKIRSNLKETKDGWLKHKPKPVEGEKYFIRKADYSRSANPEYTKIEFVKKDGVYYVKREEDGKIFKLSTMKHNECEWRKIL